MYFRLVNRFIALSVLCLVCFFARATHNRAGEITYKHISGYTYSITLVTYTYTPSAANEDRNTLTISWGDNTMSGLPRVSIIQLPDEYQKNTYTGQHSFPGPGTYSIIMEDKNRNEGIDNITESVYVPFTVKTQISINSLVGDNSAPLLLNPPIDKAAVGKLFIHNPTAFDPDGDSLSYYLTVCAGSGGKPIDGYRYPAASKTLYVDASTGDLVWDAPMAKGKYNVAMVITEFRKGIQISAIVRDIQIEVEESDNQPPKIEPITGQCIFAGDTARFNVRATDPDGGQLNLSAVGGPLSLTISPAIFAPVNGVGTVASEFSWNTVCEHIRLQPYTILFKAADAGPPSLSDQKTADISVMGRAQPIDTITAKLDEVTLKFKKTGCANAERLQIYRSRSAVPLASAGCPPPMPAGYELIADTVPGTDTFTDDNGGAGLPQGFSYCYRTQSIFPGGVPSFPSDEYCIAASSGAPVMANVSILSQTADSARVFVRWTHPNGLDTSIYPAPYRADLYLTRCDFPYEKQLVASFSDYADTSAVSSAAFHDAQLCYQVQWYSLGSGTATPIGRPVQASSPRLTATVSDQRVELQCSADVPWQNSKYTIFRSADSGQSWDSIGQSLSPSYSDTSVSNSTQYCYRMQSEGHFSMDGYPKNLFNGSNTICATPADTVAPARPALQITQDCGGMRNIISQSGKTAANGVSRYFLYYKECENSEFRLIATLDSLQSEYAHSFADSARTMGGCYAMSAQDANGNTSGLSEPACIYSCPTYQLPNVFTPDGDGVNDLWRPTQNKFVQRIDLQIFDIWGNVVFSTTDPQIRWNGANMRGQKLSDGMFYYICDVYEQWLSCKSEPRTIIGFIQKFSDGKPLPTTK